MIPNNNCEHINTQNDLAAAGFFVAPLICSLMVHAVLSSRYQQVAAILRHSVKTRLYSYIWSAQDVSVLLVGYSLIETYSSSHVSQIYSIASWQWVTFTEPSWELSNIYHRTQRYPNMIFLQIRVGTNCCSKLRETTTWTVIPFECMFVRQGIEKALYP